MFTITAGAATVSAFMNNTPVVVILTPVTIALAHSVGLSASKFLIPLSYATVLGGTCSLIGTSTNIVANGAAIQQGMAPFSLFEISPVGIPLTMIGIIYLCTVGLRILPSRETFSGIMAGSRQRQFLTEVLVPLGSPLVGKTADESGVAKKLNARVIDVIRDRISLASEMDKVVLQAGDRVVLRTNVGDVLGLRDKSDVVFGATGQHAIEPIATQNTRGDGGHRRPALALRRLSVGRPQPAPAVQRLHPGRAPPGREPGWQFRSGAARLRRHHPAGGPAGRAQAPVRAGRPGQPVRADRATAAARPWLARALGAGRP